MLVEKFSKSVINSGIFKIYIATGFFATLIFFVINAELFTPMEMILGVVFITIILKGISNMMLSMIILLFSLDNKKNELAFNSKAEKIDFLLNELKAQDAELNNIKA